MWFTQLSRQRGWLSSVVFFPLLVGQRVEAAKLGCSASKPCVYPGPVLAGKGAAGGDRRPARPVLRYRGALPSARSLQGTRGFPTHRGADLRPLLRDRAARRTPAPPHPGERPVAGRTPRPVTALGLRSGTWQPRAVNAERTLGSTPPPALRAWPPRSTAVPLLGQLARGAVPRRGAGGPAPQPPLPSPARAALARSHRGHPGTARGLRGAWQLAQVCVCRGSPCWGCCPRDPGKRRGGEPVTPEGPCLSVPRWHSCPLPRCFRAACQRRLLARPWVPGQAVLAGVPGVGLGRKVFTSSRASSETL